MSSWAWGHTADQIEYLDEVLTKLANQAYAEYTGAMREAAHQADQTNEATEEGTEATEEATEAEYDHAAAIDAVVAARKRAASPVLQAIEASKRAREAQVEYNEALDNFPPGSDEAVEAAGNLIEAQGDLDAALAQIVRDSGPSWREEFRAVARQARISEEDIDAMIAKVEEADGMSATVTVETETGHAQDALDRWIARNRNRSITVPVRAGGVSGRRSHTGEHRVSGPRGSEQTRIVRAGERILDENEADLMDKGHDMVGRPISSRFGAGLVPTTVVNITVQAGISDPFATAKKIQELLQQYNRIGGPLDIEVKTL